MVIQIDEISKLFGTTAALHPVSLSIPGGALVALLGPSGSGKTTLLRILAGLEEADGGEVLIDGRRERLRHKAERDGQRGEHCRGEPQAHVDLVHRGHGRRNAVLIVREVLGGKGAPQKAQGIGHGEDGTCHIGHQDHIARHANEQSFVHGGFQHGLLGHKTKERGNACHG